MPRRATWFYARNVMEGGWGRFQHEKKKLKGGGGLMMWQKKTDSTNNRLLKKILVCHTQDTKTINNELNQ